MSPESYLKLNLETQEFLLKKSADLLEKYRATPKGELRDLYYSQLINIGGKIKAEANSLGKVIKEIDEEKFFS